jgi:hypothetical protein
VFFSVENLSFVMPNQGYGPPVPVGQEHLYEYYERPNEGLHHAPGPTKFKSLLFLALAISMLMLRWPSLCFALAISMLALAISMRWPSLCFLALAISMLMCLYITGNVDSVLSCMDNAFMVDLFNKLCTMETETLKCMVGVTTAIFDVFEMLSATDNATMMTRFFTVYNSTVMPLEVIKKNHGLSAAYAEYSSGKHDVVIRGNFTMCSDEIIFVDNQYTLLINDICLGAKIAQMLYLGESKTIFCRHISKSVDLWRVEVNQKCEELSRKNTNNTTDLDSNSNFDWNIYNMMSAVVTCIF